MEDALASITKTSKKCSTFEIFLGRIKKNTYTACVRCNGSGLILVHRSRDWEPENVYCPACDGLGGADRRNDGVGTET